MQGTDLGRCSHRLDFRERQRRRFTVARWED
jgi:hypothetical protein